MTHIVHLDRVSSLSFDRAILRSKGGINDELGGCLLRQREGGSEQRREYDEETHVVGDGREERGSTRPRQ